VSTVERIDPPMVGDERSQLEQWLAWHRATVHAKCAGLAEEHAWTAPLPSSPLVSMGGIVNHLVWVEFNWFNRVLNGEDREYAMVPFSDDDPDGDFRQVGDETLADGLARYAAQCAVSREIAAKLDLDATGDRRGMPCSLRWIYLHMIEETARHNGHLDAIRELLDGVVGD
jgi:uncharacterized damage-inducible protein DinB